MAEGALLFAGAAVQRVDVAPDAVVLRLRAPGETRYLLVVAGRPGPLVGLCQQRPLRGAGMAAAVPLGEKLRWRSRLEGARVIGLGERRIVLAKEGVALVIETAPAAGARVSLREARADDALGEAVARAEDAEAWLARGERLASTLGEGALTARRQDLARALARAVTRVERRVAAVAGDLARIAGADTIAAQAAAFVAEAARAPRGASRLVVTDWSTGEPRELTLALDPARSAREQLDAMFRRARRLKLGAAIAGRRLADARAAADRLTALAARAAEEATTFAAIDAIAAEARAAAPRDFALGQAASAGKKDAARGAQPSRPYRIFPGVGGARILVGKGAAGNDAVTFRVARPHDLWLHAKGRTGAHVIVPLDKGHACPSELLVEAAHLAAHFSEGRAEAVIEVQHTPRRHLRKPRGAAPGFVVVDREKVIALRVEPDVVTRLLAAEELG